VVGHGKERVRIGRQVDTDDLGLLVNDVVDEARILMREAVVILPPHMRAEEVVERCDRAAPWDRARDLEPLRMLVEHRVDDVDERLVAVEEAVPTRQQVTLEPALTEVLREDLHHPPVRRETFIRRKRRCGPRPPCDVEDVAEPVRSGFVRAEQPEVVPVMHDHVPQECAQHSGRLAEGRRRRGNVDGVVAEVRQH
jgi:hypothetical protein